VNCKFVTETKTAIYVVVSPLTTVKITVGVYMKIDPTSENTRVPVNPGLAIVPWQIKLVIGSNSGGPDPPLIKTSP